MRLKEELYDALRLLACLCHVERGTNSLLRVAGRSRNPRMIGYIYHAHESKVSFTLDNMVTEAAPIPAPKGNTDSARTGVCPRGPNHSPPDLMPGHHPVRVVCKREIARWEGGSEDHSAGKVCGVVE